MRGVGIKISNNFQSNSINKSRIKVLFFDISECSQTTQFCVCSIAVFAFFLLYGYVQELIFTLDGFKPFGWYLTLVQFGFYSLFGLLEKHLTKEEERRIPMKTYFLLALLTLGTMGLSNSSLGYLNYPTQVIFKCCKLIPVLVGSILIQGKRYGPIDFIAAILMCVGLTIFILADSMVSPNFHVQGVLMISMALLCDAVIGNVQEKAMKTFNAPNSEVVLYSYSIGFSYIFIVMLFTGDFIDGFRFFAQNPIATYGYSMIFSLTGYLGIQIVLTLVRTCGAFVAVTVTTCRKAVTIIASFLFFSKPFTFQYLYSGILVIIGIYLNVYSKHHPLTFTDLELKIIHLINYINVPRKYKRMEHIVAEV